jgi:hypothetical protein
VEVTLLEQARLHDPYAVRQLGRRILAHLDPDGPSPEEQSLQQVHRQLKLTGLDDATGLLTGRLSPTCRAIWQTILTALANCRPDDALGPDDRTIPQRWHDAFEEAGRRQGAAADPQRRRRRARLRHRPPAPTAGLRKAIIARDRGCTSRRCPGQPNEPNFGRFGLRFAPINNTPIDQVLQRLLEPGRGWRTVMIDGVPHWQPPSWHPTREPQRNYLHHPELLTSGASDPGPERLPLKLPLLTARSVPHGAARPGPCCPG